MDLEQAKKILDACKEMENQCSSEEELYDYMADNTDLINKAMEVLLEEEQRQEDTEKKEHTNLAVEEDDDVMFVPQDFTGWAALNRNQIRRINYEDPDSIADALFDLLQGSLVGA